MDFDPEFCEDLPLILAKKLRILPYTTKSGPKNLHFQPKYPEFWSKYPEFCQNPEFFSTLSFIRFAQRKSLDIIYFLPNRQATSESCGLWVGFMFFGPTLSPPEVSLNYDVRICLTAHILCQSSLDDCDSLTFWRRPPRAEAMK